MSTVARAFAIIALLLAPVPVHATGDLRLLSRPGAVAILRHAIAPGTGDPREFALGDCATQRNLDERGREQARQIGAALRERGIVVDRVLTSEWCRASETAELLAVAPVEPFPALNSFFADRSSRAEQTEAVRAFLAARSDEERLILVTHQVNITALTGRFASSGEMIVFDVGPDGTIEVIGTVKPARPR